MPNAKPNIFKREITRALGFFKVIAGDDDGPSVYCAPSFATTSWLHAVRKRRKGRIPFVSRHYPELSE